MRRDATRLGWTWSATFLTGTAFSELDECRVIDGAQERIRDLNYTKASGMLFVKIIFPICFFILLFNAGCGNHEVISPRSPKSLLESDPPNIRFGKVRFDDRASASLQIKNTSDHTVSVAEVVTSCPCLTMLGFPATIKSGDVAVMQIHFDPSKESEFRGSLAIELTGKGYDNDELFRTQVDVEVVDFVDKAKK